MKLRSLLISLLIFFSVATGLAIADPIKVFILVGQSNMQGHARTHTLQHLQMDPKTVSLHNVLVDDKGQPRVFENVWINSLSDRNSKSGTLSAGFGADESKIGPEYAFGASMHKRLGEPILIIKAAWGGKSLHTDFRPPSAGEFEFSAVQIERIKKQGKDIVQEKATKKEATGKFYRMTIDHVRNVLASPQNVFPNFAQKRDYELAGIVWFQGWNDMVDSGVYPTRDKKGGYSQYSDLLAHLIRDMRKDLNAPDLPFVIGVMGVGGPTEKYSTDQQRYVKTHQNFRDAMAAPAALPEFEGNVAIVRTENYWHAGLAGLRQRQAKIHREVRKATNERKLDQTARKEFEAKLFDQEFSDKEKVELEKGVSNLEYHYLGSATILSQIGEAFAEAMLELSHQPTPALQN